MSLGLEDVHFLVRIRPEARGPFGWIPARRILRTTPIWSAEVITLYIL